MGNQIYPGTVLGDVVGAVAWGSKIYTLRGGLDGCEQMCTVGGGGWLRTNVYAACSGGVVGLSWGDVDSCGDDSQYKVMKYLVFGTISTSLLSKLIFR
jgi:hypothetical protein